MDAALCGGRLRFHLHGGIVELLVTPLLEAAEPHTTPRAAAGGNIACLGRCLSRCGVCLEVELVSQANEGVLLGNCGPLMS